ncbi:MAG: class I SAM-dependent methyltransferase [Gammaproteobacteria bacterium]|nr:class I SAM-dependent methyltransferase [Gammaproteobacteria bacterium]
MSAATGAGEAGLELELFARAVNWKRYWASVLRPYLGRRVLEVGAGIGESTRALCDGGAGSWLCLEPETALAARIEAKLHEGTLPACCTLRVGTLQDLEPGERFDTIFYIDVLEHIEDDTSEVAAAAARLEEGGHLCVLVPAHQQLFSEFDRMIGHHRRYDRASLDAVVGGRLERVMLRYLDSVGYLANLANRMLLRQSLPSEAQILFWDRVMVRASRVLDPLLLHRCGRSLLGVWRKRSGSAA